MTAELVLALNIATAIVNGIAPGEVGLVDARLVDRHPEFLARVCGARLRSGATCTREPLAGARRCRAHGAAGGRQTDAGRRRISAAMKRRWALSRHAIALSHAGKLPEGTSR